MKRWKYLLHAAVFLGLAAAVFKYLDAGAFWKTLQGFDPSCLPALLVSALLYLGFKAVRYCYLQARTNPTAPGIVLRAYQAGQAGCVLPGGIALRAGLLKEAGISLPESGPPIAISGLADWAAMLLCSLLAALWFPAARAPTLLLLGVLAGCGLLLAWAPARSRLLGWTEALMERLRLGAGWRDCLGALGRLLGARVLLVSLLLSLASVAAGAWTLDVSLRSVGGEVSLLTALFASALPTLLGRVSALPAGFGVTEAGIAGILHASPGVSLDQAAAAVTVFRLATVLLDAALGAVVYVLPRPFSAPAESGELA